MYRMLWLSQHLAILCSLTVHWLQPSKTKLYNFLYFNDENMCSQLTWVHVYQRLN